MRDPEEGWRWWLYVAGQCVANLPRAVWHPLPVVDALINLKREAVWPAEIRGAGPGSLTLAERLFLRWLCSVKPMSAAFEFGTWRGWTTDLLAGYAQHVYTLSLHGPAYCCRPKVTCLFGDSLTFDFSPYKGQMDLVFVDGGHDWKTVASDSMAAEALRKPDGVIIWHDCNVQHRDVWKFLQQRRGWGASTLRVEGTRLAVDLGPMWTYGFP